MSSSKMGRPTDNPKSNSLNVRLDQECFEILKKYCDQENVTRAEGIRHGIKMLSSKIKKEQ